MHTIHKYRLSQVDVQTIEMPKGAQILTAQFQGPDLCIWALVNTDHVMDKRRIEIIGTGNPIDPSPLPENTSAQYNNLHLFGTYLK